MEDGSAHTFYYNKSALLFPLGSALQHKSSAISMAAHNRLLSDLARRIYKTSSTISGFLQALSKATGQGTSRPRHPASKVLRAARQTLDRTTTNRYGLSPLQISNLTF